jgi:tripartite-type tricarboxylate transporter receptor subunit TctC
MNKFIIATVALLMATISNAAESVTVYNRFPIESPTAYPLTAMVKEMNTMQTKYNFIISTISSAGGETADQKTIAEARNGRKTLVFGSTSTYGMNKYLFGNTFDRENDLIPVISIFGGSFAFIVNPESKIQTLDDLIAHIKSKPVAYYARTTSTGNTVFLEAIFRNTYNITNVKELAYGNVGDLIRSITQGESDYTVYPTAFYPNLKHIVVSSEHRSKELPNVPTAKEAGFNEFEFSSMQMLSVPKEQLEFAKEISSLLEKSCYANDVRDVVEKTHLNLFCYSTEMTKSKIKSEVSLLKKYQHLIEIPK